MSALRIIRELIRANLSRVPDLTGASSLATGADQIFAEEVLALKGSLHVILPSKAYERSFGSSDDLARFRMLLSRADSVETLAFEAPSEEAYLAAGRWIVDTSDSLIAVWDGRPPRGKGGTGDIVAYARSRGVGVSVIWPHGVAR